MAGYVACAGRDIPGVIDPAARGRSQKDGFSLTEIYSRLGLDLEPADHAVEAGLYAVWSLLSTGSLKICSGLTNWLTEYRLYRRDEGGKVVKTSDHLMDATRYLVMSGRDRARYAPPAEPLVPDVEYVDAQHRETGWMM